MREDISTLSRCQCDNEDVNTLRLFMDIGAMMIRNGSEVKRVEDTLRRMGKAYGAERMDVFAITSTLVCTMNMPDGTVCSMTRGTRDGTKTDFWKLERINALSREYCRKKIDTDKLKICIEDIEHSSAPRFRVCLGSVLAAGTLAVFFGGNILDGVFAAVFALAIWLMQVYFALVCTNNILFNFVCSFVTGVLIGVAGHIFPIHGDKVMIGDIMLLIPGLALTNAVKDMFVGDTITGSLRLVESLLWAVAIACGFALAVYIVGGV